MKGKLKMLGVTLFITLILSILFVFIKSVPLWVTIIIAFIITFITIYAFVNE